MMNNDLVMFTNYEPRLVRRANEKPLPTLSEAIAVKASHLSMTNSEDSSKVGEDKKKPLGANFFDVDTVPAASDWWQTDLLAKIQPGAADFDRALRSMGLQIGSK